MPINGSYICDEQGEPLVFRMRGADPSQREKIEPVYLEVRPGGMTVVRSLPAGRITVAADPIMPPSQAEVEADRLRRAEDSRQREIDAVRQERELRGEEPPRSDDTLVGRQTVATEPIEDTQETVNEINSGSDENAESDSEREEREAREATARKSSGSAGRSRARAGSK